MLFAIKAFLSAKWIPIVLGFGSFGLVYMFFTNWLDDQVEKGVLQAEIHARDNLHELEIKLKDDQIEATEKLALALMENTNAAKRESEFKSSRQSDRKQVVDKARSNPKIRNILDEKVPTNLIY